MKTKLLLFVLNVAFVATAAEPPPPVYQQTPAPPVQPPTQAAAAPAATPAPPPATPSKRSAADLEKLVAPIALYPDPLIATMLPASVYPLEIVQAARFVANTNNLAQLDAQPWDDNVKAVARVPDAIKKMNDELSWTMDLGEAFLAQDKDIMDAIQAMRSKAQKAGTLQTTPQQIVIVTNMLIEKTVEQQIVFVTNTVVQIQPASSTVIYVPAYNPYTVYYPPPAYVYNPMAPLVTFAAGVTMGVIIANNVNWYHGGCYHGYGNVNVNVNNNNNVNINNNNNYNQNNNINNKSGNSAQAKNTSAQTKWQPDQSRLSKSGAPSAATSARNAEARGYGSGGAQPSAGSSARPATGAAGARPSTGTPSANRPAASPAASRPAPSAAAARPASSPSASPSRPASTPSRPSSSGSAYGGLSSGGSNARADSSRGAASRSGGGGGSHGGGGGRR